MTTDTLLEFNGVDFSYEGKDIVRDMNLAFPRSGRMVGLIGPNGVGKTTILRLMMRLEWPEAGQITLQGKPISKFDRKELARTVTLVPQDTHVDFPFTVEDMVAMGRHPRKKRFQPLNEEDHAIIQRALKATATDHLVDQAVNTLSGGERQRVLVARAIVQQTSIILLDEVTANLDLCHQLEVMDLARSLADQGKLVIATIHDLSLASRYCDQILLLGEQALQSNAPPTAVLTSENLERFFSIDARIDPSAHVSPGLIVTPIRPTNSQLSQTINASQAEDVNYVDS